MRTKLFIQISSDNCKRNENGYTTRLLWKKDHIFLPSNKELAAEHYKKTNQIGDVARLRTRGTN